MALVSGFRDLRRVACGEGAPGVAYESVALPLSYPGVRPTHVGRMNYGRGRLQRASAAVRAFAERFRADGLIPRRDAVFEI